MRLIAWYARNIHVACRTNTNLNLVKIENKLHGGFASSHYDFMFSTSCTLTIHSSPQTQYIARSLFPTLVCLPVRMAGMGIPMIKCKCIDKIEQDTFRCATRIHPERVTNGNTNSRNFRNKSIYYLSHTHIYKYSHLRRYRRVDGKRHLSHSRVKKKTEKIKK